jgi:dihydrofolate reductase
MRRIIAHVNTTLDGYMEGPKGEGDLGWLMPYVPESVPDAQAMLVDEIDTILLGRRTYEGFASYWPFEEGEFADAMNNPLKLVFASPASLTETPWGDFGNAELVDRDVEGRVRELKAGAGKDMVISASGGLASSFLNLGLVDELRIGVCPVVLGKGLQYFRGIDEQVTLERTEAKPYPSGATLMTYNVKSQH